MTSPEDEPLFSSQTSGKPRTSYILLHSRLIARAERYLLGPSSFPGFAKSWFSWSSLLLLFANGYQLVKSSSAADLAFNPVTQHQPRFTRPLQRIEVHDGQCPNRERSSEGAYVETFALGFRQELVFMIFSFDGSSIRRLKKRDGPSRSWRRLEIHLMLLLDGVMEHGGARMKSSHESEDRRIIQNSNGLERRVDFQMHCFFFPRNPGPFRVPVLLCQGSTSEPANVFDIPLVSLLASKADAMSLSGLGINSLTYTSLRTGRLFLGKVTLVHSDNVRSANSRNGHRWSTAIGYAVYRFSPHGTGCAFLYSMTAPFSDLTSGSVIF
ncbi:uncharacterized protein BT62DRAFT_1006360 [Guyanagaster necrorhizus]|uniref:Uncharacterized protein n=1 Tax=Guyanagaster necrorhizus TaxID=856835 RepID=A0A9P7VT66_9AGAR|nr:uncharacterized protein BT62DRAFT_1006360 [Guyanagaster necrorhizus MCA 3950]KAG7446153.1 hypothetical protein BT62DRAFT_1006360 [Guyanagaster necrorhizus MCA 3950]